MKRAALAFVFAAALAGCNGLTEPNAITITKDGDAKPAAVAKGAQPGAAQPGAATQPAAAKPADGKPGVVQPANAQQPAPQRKPAPAPEMPAGGSCGG